MANASGVALQRLTPGAFLHKQSGIEYEIYSQGGAAWLSYRRSNDPAIEGKKRLDYFLGSGHLGLTYLYSTNGYLLESPIAYYADPKAYDMKPGLERIEHMPGALPVNATCLRCHMSAVQRPDAGTENHYQDLPFLHTGITCESCHGDTRRHVTSRGIVSVVSPANLVPAKRDSICIACHLEGTTSVERRDHSVLDFEPGKNIADYISYFTYSRENATSRGVSEIEQFTSSKCKRTTGEAMSCMNCHDPHRSPAPDERVAFYRRKCLTCHAQPLFETTHYPANRDCTSCHMPKTGARNIPHVAWTDHRILKHPNQEDVSNADASPDRELTPILPGSGSRELALAYYNLAVSGHVSALPRAIALLSAAAQSSPDDEAVLRALGVLGDWEGNGANAEALYRRVLERDPTSLAAASNLGTILAKSGKLQAAAELWRPIFARNEDILGLGQNLATVECMLGQRDRAVNVLTRVLIYSPDMPEIRTRLKTITSSSQLCTMAAQSFP
jgi:Flp pilus assembly protein TadD